MVYFITGPMNSGKTSRLKALFYEMTQESDCLNYQSVDFSMDGFIAIKEMEGHLVKGYKAHQLSTGYEMDMIIRDAFLKGDETISDRLGPYCFLANTFKWIDVCIKDLISFNVKAIFLDEVGQLELSAGGYDLSIRKILKSKADLYVTTREDLMEDIVTHYGIRSYKVIR